MHRRGGVELVVTASLESASVRATLAGRPRSRSAASGDLKPPSPVLSGLGGGPVDRAVMTEVGGRDL